MNILITGGAGYIGSHISYQLMYKGHSLVIIDNLSNSNISVINKLNKINKNKAVFYEGDICDRNILNEVFTNNNRFSNSYGWVKINFRFNSTPNQIL